MEWAVEALDAVAREVLLFAAFGFLVGGIDDLLIDLVFLARALAGGAVQPSLEDLPPPVKPRRFAVFVPAWDEAGVIGAMLASALARIRHPFYRLYVGCYPNDPATIAAVEAVAARNQRVRIVVGPREGPTTKGCNLNTLWRALLADDAAEGTATHAVVLHDAEDVIHASELHLFDAMLDRHAVVQIPVEPLIAPGARLISGHYADEFAEAHGKAMVVRGAVGAGLPLAGVGCAIRLDALRALAEARGGAPFDPTSLTEDYELGLHLAELGFPGRFARVAERRGGPLIASRAYFPGELGPAVRQKARWLTGIALAGWDRTGWARPLHLSDHWMRARDRRGPLAVMVLAAAYLGLLLWGGGLGAHWWTGLASPAVDPVLARILAINGVLLGWRTACRAAFTGRVYGWREAIWSVPRLLVSNYVALLAVRRAIWRYLAMLRGGAPVWDKTAHLFPTLDEVRR